MYYSIYLKNFLVFMRHFLPGGFESLHQAMVETADEMEDSVEVPHLFAPLYENNMDSSCLSIQHSKTSNNGKRLHVCLHVTSLFTSGSVRTSAPTINMRNDCTLSISMYSTLLFTYTQSIIFKPSNRAWTI